MNSETEQKDKPVQEQAQIANKKLTTNQKIMIVGITVVTLAIITVGILYFLSQREGPEAAVFGDGNLVADGMDFDSMRSRAADNMFEVKMNSVWTFPSGDKPATDAYVANSEANHRALYFDVTLPDTGEVLYTSPKIPLGNAVSGFTLTKPLEAGSYEAYCNFHTLDDDDVVEDTITVAVTIRVGT